MRLHEGKSHLIAVSMLALACSGCQVTKGTFGRLTKTDLNDSRGDPPAGVAQASVKEASPNEPQGLDQSSQDRLAIESASKRIDGSVISALRNDVPIDEYNHSSHGATNYRTVAKVAPSKSGGCASGCSH
jgi:hypothetical protein